MSVPSIHIEPPQSAPSEVGATVVSFSKFCHLFEASQNCFAAYLKSEKKEGKTHLS